MLELPSFKESMEKVMKQTTPPPNLETPPLNKPTETGMTENQHTATTIPSNGNPNREASEHGNKPITKSNDDDDTDSLRDLQKLDFSEQFREFCGNPTGYEYRIRHLEHHTEMLLKNNLTAQTEAKLAPKAASNRDLELASKKGELLDIVDDSMIGVDRALSLEGTVHQHSQDIKKNTKKIGEVENDIKETESRFEDVVENAGEILESQSYAAEATKADLVLLTKNMNKSSEHHKQPYLQRLTNQSRPQRDRQTPTLLID